MTVCHAWVILWLVTEVFIFKVEAYTSALEHGRMVKFREHPCLTLVYKDNLLILSRIMDPMKFLRGSTYPSMAAITEL